MCAVGFLVAADAAAAAKAAGVKALAAGAHVQCKVSKVDKKRKLVTVTVKGKGAVDPDSGLDEGAHIFQRRDEVSAVLLHGTFLPCTCMGCWLLSLSSPVRSDLLVVCG